MQMLFHNNGNPKGKSKSKGKMPPSIAAGHSPPAVEKRKTSLMGKMSGMAAASRLTVPVKTKGFDGPMAVDDQVQSQPPTLEQLAGIAWEGDGGNSSGNNSGGTNKKAAAIPVPTKGASIAVPTKGGGGGGGGGRTGQLKKQRSCDYLETLMRDDEMHDLPPNNAHAPSGSSSRKTPPRPRGRPAKSPGRSKSSSQPRHRPRPRSADATAQMVGMEELAALEAMQKERDEARRARKHQRQQEQQQQQAQQELEQQQFERQLEHPQQMRPARKIPSGDRSHCGSIQSADAALQMMEELMMEGEDHHKDDEFHQSDPMLLDLNILDALAGSESVLTKRSVRKSSRERKKASSFYQKRRSSKTAEGGKGPKHPASFHAKSYDGKQKQPANKSRRSSDMARPTTPANEPKKSLSFPRHRKTPPPPARKGPDPSEGHSPGGASPKAPTHKSISLPVGGRRVPTKAASAPGDTDSVNTERTERPNAKEDKTAVPAKLRRPRRTSPHPVRGFEDPSLARRKPKADKAEDGAPKRSSTSSTEDDHSVSNATVDNDDDDDDDDNNSISNETVDPADDLDLDASLADLDGQSPDQLNGLIGMMQAEFTKLRSAKVDAETRASTLETDLVSSQQERDAEFMRLMEESNGWKRAAQQGRVRLEGAQGKAARLEKEHAAMKAQCEKLVHRVDVAEVRNEELEEENRALRGLLAVYQSKYESKRSGGSAASGGASGGKQPQPKSKVQGRHLRDDDPGFRDGGLKEAGSHDGGSVGGSSPGHVAPDSPTKEPRRQRSGSIGGSHAAPGVATATKCPESPTKQKRRHRTPPPFHSIHASRKHVAQYAQTFNARQRGAAGRHPAPSPDSALQAPASWHGGNKKVMIRNVPVIVPPLHSGGVDRSTTEKAAATGPPARSRGPPSKSKSHLRRSAGTASTAHSSFTAPRDAALRDSTLSASIKEDEQLGQIISNLYTMDGLGGEFSSPGGGSNNDSPPPMASARPSSSRMASTRSLDGMVEMMAAMMENSDEEDDDYFGIDKSPVDKSESARSGPAY